MSNCNRNENIIKPKISVITVCFNSETTIKRAIDSVINQDYDNFEYIIIDGNSCDSTKSIIEKYKQKIAYFVSEPDEGISDAFNKGIKYSTGDIICIVNSDDVMPYGALTRFSKYYDSSIDVYRGSELIKGGGKKNIVLHPSLRYPRIPMFFHSCHMATFISKWAFDKYGLYDNDYKIAMDRELLFRFHYNGATEKRIKGIYGVFFRGGASYHNNQILDAECIRIQEKYSNPSAIDRGLYRFLIFVKRKIKKN